MSLSSTDIASFQLAVTTIVRYLFYFDVDGLAESLWCADLDSHDAWLASALDCNDEHTMEEVHLWFDEALQRRSVAVADGLEGACTAHLYTDLVRCVGAECAVFVGQCHGDVAEIIAVGGERVLVGCELQG